MNAGLKKYQAMTKAAKAVSEGKAGSKTKLAAAKRAYLKSVKETAAKDLKDKVAAAEKKAKAVDKIASVGRAKKKTTAAKKKAAPKKRTTKAKSTTKRKR